MVATVVDRWPQIGLPDCWLVAGCLAQTVWNDVFGRPATHGISDVDLVYFDGADLSVKRRKQAMPRGSAPCFADLGGLWIDVKNEPASHLVRREIRQHAGALCLDRGRHARPFRRRQRRSACSRARMGFMSFAPYGLSDLLGLIVRPNKKQITQAMATMPK